MLDCNQAFAILQTFGRNSWGEHLISDEENLIARYKYKLKQFICPILHRNYNKLLKSR